jgi:hypothetical protein
LSARHWYDARVTLRLAALTLVALSAAACTKAQPPSGGTPSGDSPSVSAMARTPRDCASIQRDFDDAVDAPSALACSADTDCGCYPGGVSQKHGCGGIANKTAVRAAEMLAAEMSAAGCHTGIACAAWSCTPRCKGGRCVNSP